MVKHVGLNKERIIQQRFTGTGRSRFGRRKMWQMAKTSAKPAPKLANYKILGKATCKLGLSPIGIARTPCNQKLKNLSIVTFLRVCLELEGDFGRTHLAI
jgi:hypothetical protein